MDVNAFLLRECARVSAGSSNYLTSEWSNSHPCAAGDLSISWSR